MVYRACKQRAGICSGTLQCVGCIGPASNEVKKQLIDMGKRKQRVFAEAQAGATTMGLGKCRLPPERRTRGRYPAAGHEQ
ncbi:hypothetical protein BHE74_00043537 [Ensete ventricosum]|nr:hypothetical protein BHE74_00043537 [Ensete ventricosum]